MIPVANARTFQNDLHLPALPYPSLKNSLFMYLDLLNAIMPTHVFLHYKTIIERFAIEDSYLLEKNHKNLKQNYKSWIEEWWLQKYHLNSEIELIPFCMISGFSGLHETEWLADFQSPMQRGARYLHALLNYWCCLRQEIIAPERLPSGEMLSMNMYRNIFNSGRIPGKSGYVIYRYFRTICEGDCPTHILLSIQGYTFKVNFIEKETVWSVENIERTFNEIFEKIRNQDINNNLSPATSLPKSQLQSALSYTLDDAEFVDDIKKSILWFSFDEATPPYEQLLMSVIGCDSQNRCGIKSFSVTVFANGFIGLNADSALMDPVVLTRIIEFADRHISENLNNDSYPYEYKYKKDMKIIAENWEMKDFTVPDILQNEIFYIRKIYNMKAYQLDCGFRHYKWFNLKIARAWNLNPTVVVHLLILLTYWEMHRAFTTSCAIVSQRKFYRGRQDIVPTITVDTVNWIHAVASKKCSRDKLKILFLLAHKKLQLMFEYCENNCGPVLHLNFINTYFHDSSRELKNLCDDTYWHSMGFSDKFALKTIYLGEKHLISIIPPSLRLGYSFSYSVSEESTLLTVIHRCFEDQLNPRLPKLFLKEFITSVEILNQMFTN